MNDRRQDLRQCLVPPPPEAAVAADLLSNAADALINRDRSRASELLCEANMPVLHAYATLAMSQSDEVLKLRTIEGAPLRLARAERSITRMPDGVFERAIYRRDGYRCRYCGGRVVLKAARSVMTALLPDAVRWPGGPGGDKNKHGAFLALNGGIDHIVPHARGGDNSPENLVTSCWPCNFGKWDHLLEELGVIDPRIRPPIVDDWEGLEKFVTVRRGLLAGVSAGDGKKRSRAERDKSPRPADQTGVRTLGDWLSFFEGRPTGIARGLGDLLGSLVGAHVNLSIDQWVIVNVTVGPQTLAVLGVDRAGNVEVPWLIGSEKARFKPFAIDLAHSIPGAKLYETKTMWRVDGSGDRKGQISVDELLASADIVRSAVAKLVSSYGGPA